MRTLLLEDMTWPEVEQALADGYKTVLIFSAAIEQHGRHLAENTDTVLGYAEAEALAKTLGKALVAPVIRPGLSDHHMALPGSLTLRPEVFAGIVQDYIACYVRHGFETIVVTSSHGGNINAVEEIVAQERPKYPGVKIVTASSIREMTIMLMAAEKEFGLVPGTCGGHACDFETSVMLYVAPQHVRMEEAVAGYVGMVDEAFVNKLFKGGVTAIDENGILGDPTGATAERGRMYFEKSVFEMAKTVKAKLDGYEKL